MHYTIRISGSATQRVLLRDHLLIALPGIYPVLISISGYQAACHVVQGWWAVLLPLLLLRGHCLLKEGKQEDGLHFFVRDRRRRVQKMLETRGCTGQRLSGLLHALLLPGCLSCALPGLWSSAQDTAGVQQEGLGRPLGQGIWASTGMTGKREAVCSCPLIYRVAVCGGKPGSRAGHRVQGKRAGGSFWPGAVIASSAVASARIASTSSGGCKTRKGQPRLTRKRAVCCKSSS